jgi:hypothetical protein
MQTAAHVLRHLFAVASRSGSTLYHSTLFPAHDRPIAVTAHPCALRDSQFTPVLTGILTPVRGMASSDGAYLYVVKKAWVAAAARIDKRRNPSSTTERSRLQPREEASSWSSTRRRQVMTSAPLPFPSRIASRRCPTCRRHDVASLRPAKGSSPSRRFASTAFKSRPVRCAVLPDGHRSSAGRPYEAPFLGSAESP